MSVPTQRWLQTRGPFACRLVSCGQEFTPRQRRQVYCTHACSVIARAEADRRMPEDRFRALLVRGGPDECWPWQGAIQTGGYGSFFVEERAGRKRTTLAHRFAYAMSRGPIPEGLQLDHLCRNRACCNPAHLEAVTARENVRRGIAPAAHNARKTHCIHGHELSEGNTYTSNPRRRNCRACAIAASRTNYARRSA